MMTHILVISFILIISIFAYRIQSLSKSGAISSMFVGAAIYFGFAINGLILLGIFFGTSSLWSFYKRQQKKVLEDKVEKGSQRDWIQVFANGGIAAACSVLFYLTKDFIWVIAFLTSIASATGDTWSSEIGPLSKRSPVSVRKFKAVEAGTSGAISLLGTVSALLGVVIITLFGYLLFAISLKEVWIIFINGILGNIFDTFLGAYFQRANICERCSIETEKLIHCSERTRKIRGLSYLNNDGVNFLANFLAPVLAILTYLFLL